MKALNNKDLGNVSGVNPIILGIAGGIIGDYIFEEMGGAEGINNGIQTGISFLNDYVATAWAEDPVLNLFRN